MNETPSYIKSLLTPTTKRPQGRKVWSIDLETVLLPFFSATNTTGDTAIPNDALGCPLRLAYDKTGAVRFSQAGRPLVRVAKEIGDSVRVMRDNFTANLLNYAGSVIKDNPEEYKAQIEASRKAGEPIHKFDAIQLDKALKAKAEALAKANAVAEAEAANKAEAVTEAVAITEAKPKPKKELVHA